MIKIDVISGFLGAGKTTLIKRLFESGFNGEKIVLIENEFGEIGIDGAFLKDSGVEIKEINSGCICCSLVGDFSKSMKEVIEKFSPDRIIVEPSGVGKLSDIVDAIEKVDAPLKLNILATVVDGPKTKVYLKNFGEFFTDQVDAANTVIINKVDKMDEMKIDEVVHVIREHNPLCSIITTPINVLDPIRLLQTLEHNVKLKDEIMEMFNHVHHDHHHDDEDEHEFECHHHEEEHDHECHHHHDDEEHDHECHHHDEECECGCHHHDEECECGCHHHDEECECGCHHHDEECECGCHHHDEECECGCGHHHHHGHDADKIFTSWGIETPKSVSKDELEKFLNVLATDESLGIVVRSKGIIKASDNEKWYYFDFVSGDYEIRLGEPDYTGRVVVIGSHIDEEKIEKLFFGRE